VSAFQKSPFLQVRFLWSTRFNLFYPPSPRVLLVVLCSWLMEMYFLPQRCDRPLLCFPQRPQEQRPPHILLMAPFFSPPESSSCAWAVDCLSSSLCDGPPCVIGFRFRISLVLCSRTAPRPFWQFRLGIIVTVLFLFFPLLPSAFSFPVIILFPTSTPYEIIFSQKDAPLFPPPHSGRYTRFKSPRVVSRWISPSVPS